MNRIGAALATDGELLDVGRGGAERIEGVRAVRPGEELGELRLGIMLVQRGQRAVLAERPRHRHRAGDVHVGGDQRKALPFRAGVEEAERAVDVDGAARIERRTLGADEHVLEIELDVGFDAHGLSSVWRENEAAARLIIDLSQRGAQTNPWRSRREGGTETERMAEDLVLYTHPMSRGRIARWMLEEVGQPYSTVTLDFGVPMRAADYLAINPMGKVPALRHGETDRHRNGGDLRLSC